MRSFNRSSFGKVSRMLVLMACLLVLAVASSFAHEVVAVETVPGPYVFEAEHAAPTVVAPMPDAIPTKVEEYVTWDNGGPMYFAVEGAQKTRKLFRGIHNVLFGWVEIPKTIMLDTVFVDPFTGFFSGLIHGTARTVERTGIGAIEMVTFWHEWPYEYQPIVMPEYVWGDLTD